MAETIEFNSKSQSIYFVLSDSTTGARKTGLANTDVTCSYTREKDNAVVIPDVTITANSSWTSGGFCQIDANNSPGLYRLDVPNEAFIWGSGVTKVEVCVTGATILAEINEIELVAPTITQGSVGASVDDQSTYVEYTYLDGTVVRDWK